MAVPLGPVPVDARLLYDNGGGIQEAGNTVIRDQATLVRIWEQATSAQSSPPPLPSIDFRTHMVLLVAGGRMSPADEIRVDSAGVRRESTPAGEREVLAVVYTVSESCRRFARDAFPVEVVQFRRYDGDVRFIENRVRGPDCR
jgi:hypothetical protein